MTETRDEMMKVRYGKRAAGELEGKLEQCHAESPAHGEGRRELKHGCLGLNGLN